MEVELGNNNRKLLMKLDAINRFSWIEVEVHYFSKRLAFTFVGLK